MLSGKEQTILELITQGRYREAERQIKSGKSDINAVNDSGETAIFLAIRGGQHELVRLCIKWGADLEHQNVLGETPLHVAREVGGSRIVQLIVSALSSQNSKQELEVNKDDALASEESKLPHGHDNGGSVPPFSAL